MIVDSMLRNRLPRRSAQALLLALGAFAVRAEAQRDVRLSVNAGTATDIAGVRSNALTASPAITFRGAAGIATLRGSGTRFDNAGWAISGGAAAVVRRPVARFLTIGADASADHVHASRGLGFTVAGATPVIEVGSSTAALFAGGQLTGAMIRVPSSSGLPVGGPFGERLAQQSTTIRRDGRTALVGGRVALPVGDATDRLDLSARWSSGIVADARETERVVAGTLAGERGTLQLSLGDRRSGEAPVGFGSVSLSVPVAHGLSVDAAAGRYPESRLTGSAAGSFASVGMSMRIGGRPQSLPRPAGTPAAAAGRTRLSLRAPDARRVEVAGDFNRWTPVAARRAPNGVWFVDLDLPPGEYRYAFRVDGSAWRVPDGSAAAADDFGGTSALLVVPASAGRARQQ
jgi:hypothetical protein